MAGTPRITLTPEDFRRYHRHILMPEVGVAGQVRLKAAKVLIVGAGGLGSPSAVYLAAAGIGRLGIVEFDLIEESNLQRQILYDTQNVGTPKIDSAVARIKALNPATEVIAFQEKLTTQNARTIISQFDIVLDGTDNYATRYLINDACVMLQKPNVYGSIFRFEGQASVFDARNGPCYRCLYPKPPPPGAVPNCAEAGVFGVLPGIIGTIQSTEVIKMILGQGESLIGRLILFDALQMKFRELRIRKDPACPVCSENPTQRELVDYDAFCAVSDENVEDISPSELHEELRAGAKIALLDVREPHEFDYCRLEGARLVPLNELPRRLEEFSRDSKYVIYCHFGGRSRRATEILRGAGFTSVRNLAGGIDAWSTDVDPSVPRY